MDFILSKKLFDLIPLVLSGHHLNRLKDQLNKESKLNSVNANNRLIEKELKSFSDNIFKSQRKYGPIF